MKDGFIKAAAVTTDIRVADCEYNTEMIIGKINEISQKDVRLAVFPELCITGYTCGDLFFQSALLDSALNSLRRIARESAKHEMLVIVGAPIMQFGKLYNCAVAIAGGEILAVVPKQKLPNYSEFYEMRHFNVFDSEKAVKTELGMFGHGIILRHKQLPDFSVGIEICEDLWSVFPPSVALAQGGANIIANLSASNEIIGKEQYRRSLVAGQSGRLLAGYIYSGAGEGESTTDMVFSGHNIIAENGAVLCENKPFSGENAISEIDVQKLSLERHKNTTFTFNHENITVVEFDTKINSTQLTRFISPTPFVPQSQTDTDERAEMILTMQAMGLKKRIAHTHAACVVIGISGGLDSSLALVVAVKAMQLLDRPATDVLAVTMPCFGTTSRTKMNAERLCSALGVSFRTVNITTAVSRHFSDIGHDPEKHDITFENCQARERTQVLMDIANQQNGLVIGTGDLSELALGWATYNGDHMSMYGVNASVPKTLIRHIVKYYALSTPSEGARAALLDVLDTPVSPELLPPEGDNISQQTEEVVGPYELHDFFLYYAVRWSFAPKKVYRLALYAFSDKYDKDVILGWLKSFYRRFFAQQFKRSCLPDSPKVGSVCLSPRADWRMPSDAVAGVWLAQLEELERGDISPNLKNIPFHL